MPSAGRTTASAVSVGPVPPALPNFALVADDAIEKVYDTSGLASGDRESKVIGQNSLGNGPANEVAIVTVA